MFGIEHEDALFLQDKETLDSRVNEGIQLLRRDAEKRSCDTVINSCNIEPRRSPDKVALVPSREIDDDYNMEGACRGRYSDGGNSLV